MPLAFFGLAVTAINSLLLRDHLSALFNKSIVSSVVKDFEQIINTECSGIALKVLFEFCWVRPSNKIKVKIFCESAPEI